MRRGLPDMWDVMNCMCSFPGCEKQPKFGRKGGSATHCSGHKEPNMRDVVHSMCAFPGCEKHPIFGRKGGSATHCKGHKEPNMRDVVHRMCAFPGGCEKRAIPKNTLCKKHRMEAERNDEKD